MDIILDLRKGMIRDHTGKSIVGLRVKCNQKSPIAIQIDGFRDEVALSLIAKKAGQTLAFWEGKVKEQQEIIIDFDTQEIREAMAQTNELEASLEFKVESQDSEAVYLSQTIGVLIVKSLFADQILPHTARPNWEIQYDQICKIGTQVAEDSAIVLKTKEVVVAAEADVKTLADTASKAAGEAEQSRQVAHELATAANQSAQDADGFSKSAATTLNAVIEQSLSVDLQSQSVSDNLGVVIAKTAEASQHASSSFTSAGEALDFRNQAQTLAVRAETAENETNRIKGEVVILKEALDQLELRVGLLKQDAVSAANEAGESATTATQAKMASETARDQAQAYGQAVGVDSQGNLTVAGRLNAVKGVTTINPTTINDAVPVDFLIGKIVPYLQWCEMPIYEVDHTDSLTGGNLYSSESNVYISYNRDGRTPTDVKMFAPFTFNSSRYTYRLGSLFIPISVCLGVRKVVITTNNLGVSTDGNDVSVDETVPVTDSAYVDNQNFFVNMSFVSSVITFCVKSNNNIYTGSIDTNSWISYTRLVGIYIANSAPPNSYPTVSNPDASVWILIETPNNTINAIKLCSMFGVKFARLRNAFGARSGIGDVGLNIRIYSNANLTGGNTMLAHIQSPLLSSCYFGDESLKLIQI